MVTVPSESIRDWSAWGGRRGVVGVGWAAWGGRRGVGGVGWMRYLPVMMRAVGAPAGHQGRFAGF